MELRYYLFENRIKVKDFAKLIDSEPGYVSMIISGKTFPGIRIAKKIEKVTAGKVSGLELMLDGVKLRWGKGAVEQ